MTHVYTIAIGKGGVGKSTTSVAIAQRLATSGHKTLLADFDRQSSSTKLLGFDPWNGSARFVERASHGLSECQLGALAGQTIRNAHNLDLDFDQKLRHNLYLLSGSNHLLAVERAKLALGESIQAAASALRPLWERMGFEAVVIDPHPGFWLYELALHLADTLIIPTLLEFASLDEIAATLATAQQVGSQPDQTIILPTLDRGLNEHDANRQTLERLYPGQVACPIADSQAVRESAAYGMTIWEYASRLPTFKRVQATYAQLVADWLLPNHMEVMS